MSKTLTLDEIFSTEAGFNDAKSMSLLEVLQAFDDGSGGGIHQVKQAILQWVADEVVGENFDTSGKTRNPYPTVWKDLNEKMDTQRQILKDHGWKGDQS